MPKTDVDAGGCAAPYLMAFKKQNGLSPQPSRTTDKNVKGVLAQLREERYA